MDTQQPSEICDLDTTYLYSQPKIKFEKNKFHFSDFSQKEFRRKYNNDWYELREYVGFNDIELIDNELIITSNYNYSLSVPMDYYSNYNILRIMAGIPGLAYSS